MGLLLENLLADITAIVLIIVTTFYLFLQYRFTYWTRKGLPTLPPSFPFGNIGPLMRQKKSIGEVVKDMYDQTKEAYIGIFLMYRPALLINDPEMIKSVLVRDSSKFQDRGTYVDEKGDPLSGNVFTLGGQKWKNMRTKMSPAFTSGKLKAMFDTNIHTSELLQKFVSTHYADKNVSIDVKDIMSRFTMDIIGNVAFGIDVNSFEDPNNLFRENGMSFFETNLRNGVINMLMFFLPKLMLILKIKVVKKSVERFMISIVKQTIEHREKNNISRPDFMQLLIQLRNSGRVSEDDDWTINSDGTNRMTVEEVAAQAYIYLIAGYETSATAMTYCLHELCVNPDIQERAQHDVDQALKKHGAKITYDSLKEMRYLDNVIDETLRKYPPLPLLNRECNENYTIPGTNIIIEKGTPIIVSLLGIQRDNQYYPDPMKFDPSRFAEENKTKLHPYTYMPFGEGPRICIGLRQGKMQAKIGLAALLSRFTFERSSKTNDPLIISPKCLVLTDHRGIWMNVKNRKNNVV